MRVKANGVTGDVCIPPNMVRPSWRKWLTNAEIEDSSETGQCVGSSLGMWFSRVRFRECHTPRTTRKDARWARRNGYVVDAEGIIRNPNALEAIEKFTRRFGH